MRARARHLGWAACAAMAVLGACREAPSTEPLREPIYLREPAGALADAGAPSTSRESPGTGGSGAAGLDSVHLDAQAPGQQGGGAGFDGLGTDLPEDPLSP